MTAKMFWNYAGGEQPEARLRVKEDTTAATILLGQVLVACFRPNQANLGIGEILRYFLGSNHWEKGDPNARVIPVLTPRPAFYSEEARDWVRRYQEELFGDAATDHPDSIRTKVLRRR